MTYTKPSAIIFDFDDTLVNARPVLTKALSATLKDFQIDPMTLKDIDFNRSMRDYFHLIFKDNLAQARDVYINYYTEFSKTLETLPHAELVLQLLQKHKVFTAVVSNKGGERLRNEVQHKFNWHHYFDAVVGAGDADEDKPSKAPALLALNSSGLEDYSNIWLIGDSIVDLQTAQNLGCKSVLFGIGVDPKDIPVHLSVENHQELLTLLEKLYA